MKRAPTCTDETTVSVYIPVNTIPYTFRLQSNGKWRHTYMYYWP